MKRLFLTLLIIAAIAISACQKDISDTDDNTGGSKTEGKYLSKVVYTDSNLKFIDSFVFDAQNRCISLYETLMYPAVFPDPNVSFYDFHYHGTDTLPYKITDTSQGRQMNWFLQYDAQDRKVVDSIVYYYLDNETWVTHYTYSVNQVVATTDYFKQGGATRRETETFYYNHSNCTRLVGNYPGASRELAMTYDSGINPYSTLNIARSVLFGVHELGFNIGFEGLNKNTYTRRVDTYSDSLNNTASVTNFQYVLDAEGHPVSSTSTGNNGWARTEKFEYKK
jgi:hypothetical protein